MRNRFLLAVLTLVTVTACSAPPAPATQGTPDDEVAIRGLAGKYAEAFNANDAAALGRLVSEDFECVLPDGTHIRGRAAQQQLEEKGVKDRHAAGLKLTLDAPTSYVKWMGATHAVSGGPWTMTGAGPAPAKGSWIAVVRKSAEGQWQITNSLVADYVAPPPAPEAKGKGK
jgi:ketosteroid isomerase-like protein